MVFLRCVCAYLIPSIGLIIPAVAQYGGIRRQKQALLRSARISDGTVAIGEPVRASVGQKSDDQIDWEAWVEERRQIFERGTSLNSYLGLKLEAAGPGWSRMRLDLRPEVMNPFGAAHGGTISALIDSAAGTAISAGTLPDDRIMGTIDMQAHFLQRATGRYLTAEARVIRSGSAVGIAQVDVHNDAGMLVAIGTATFRLGAPGTRRNRNED